MKSSGMLRYNKIAILLHWLIAVALAFQLALGFGLHDLGSRGFALFQLHKSIGITILLLSLFRLAWRWTKPRPAPFESGPADLLAKAVHAGLYIFMVGAPVTGWLLVSTAKVRVPTLLFGLIPWPHLPVPASLRGASHESHEILAYLGLALFALHVAGVIRHRLLLGDTLTERMLPGRSLGWLAGLAALLPIAWLAATALLALTAGSPAASPVRSAAGKSPPAQRPIAAPSLAKPDAGDAEANAVAATIPEEPPPAWSIAPGGRLAFTVGNGATEISGSFGRWTGSVLLDPDRPETADIRIEVDLASASIGDPTQDQMLSGSEFFDTASHPSASFRSTIVTRTGRNSYTAQGTLSLKGITRPQKLRFRLAGTGDRRAVTGSASIDRIRYRVGEGDAASGLAAVVSVSFAFDATKQQVR